MIVLTGGPCAGKTTTLEQLSAQFGESIVLVDEMASTILAARSVLPGQGIDWTPQWQHQLQSEILAQQMLAEQAAQLDSAQGGAQLIVCDRGSLDGAAYTPGGITAFCETFNINQGRELQRYAAVIHLESMASAQPELYGKANNANRFESLEVAQGLEIATRLAWAHHPNWLLIRGDQTMSDKASQVLDAVQKYI